MQLKLSDTLTVQVVENTRLDVGPSWAIRTLDVSVANAASQDEYLARWVQTVGSFPDSSAYTFRFDKATLMLDSILLRSPTTMASSETAVDAWHAMQPLPGLLQLENPANFQMMALEMIYWLDVERDIFICSVPLPVGKDPKKLRLRVAPDVDLLFCEGKFCGWMLCNPLQYVVKSWDQPEPFGQDEQFASIVFDYLRLMSVPSFDRVDDQDSEIYNEFIAIRDQATAGGNLSYQRRVLQEAIEDILSYFYD